MKDAVHVIDGACGPDILLEASRAAGEGEQMLCLGCPQGRATWAGLLGPERILAAIPRSTLLGARVRPPANPLDHDWVARCWSLGAARKLTSLGLWPGPALTLRLSSAPSEAEVRALRQFAQVGHFAVACRGESIAERVRRAGISAIVEVIPPPAAPATADDRAKSRRRLGVGDDEIAIAAPGRATRATGHRQVVWAADILCEAGYPVRVILQGSADAAHQAAEFARQTGFGGKLTVAEPSSSLGDLLAPADIAVFLHRQALPVATVAAALASGLAIVAADTPAARDWLTDGRDALLAGPGSPRQAAMAIMRIIEDKNLAARLGRSGRALAEGTFALESVRGQWRRLDERLLERMGAGQPAGTGGGTV